MSAFVAAIPVTARPSPASGSCGCACTATRAGRHQQLATPSRAHKLLSEPSTSVQARVHFSSFRKSTQRNLRFVAADLAAQPAQETVITSSTSVPVVTPFTAPNFDDGPKVEPIATPEQFDEIVRGNDLVIVDLHARWCRKCKSLVPKFERLAYEFPESRFLSLDVNNVAELPARLEVKELPTFLMIKSGKIVETYVGGASGVEIQDHIRQSLQTYRKADFAVPADAKSALPPAPAVEEAVEAFAEEPAAPAEPCVVEVETPDQWDALVGGDRLVIVDFYANHCRKCKFTLPKFAKESAKPYARGVVFAKVNVALVPRVPQEAEIHAMPAFQFWKNGQKLGGFEGAPANLSEVFEQRVAEYGA